MLGLRKPNFKTKLIRFEKSHNAENCKKGGGHFEIFLNIHSVAKFQKLKRDLKNFQKKTKNENFQQSHSAEKSERRAIWDFLPFVLLQNTKKRREESLVT